VPQTHYANTVLYAVSPVASPSLLYNTRALSGPPPDPRRGLGHCRRVGVLLASEEAAVAHTHRLRQPDGRQRPSVLGTVLHCTHKHIPPISPRTATNRHRPSPKANTPGRRRGRSTCSCACAGPCVPRFPWGQGPVASRAVCRSSYTPAPRQSSATPEGPAPTNQTHNDASAHSPHCHINAPSASNV
jgi:hypothetical protein